MFVIMYLHGIHVLGNQHCKDKFGCRDYFEAIVVRALLFYFIFIMLHVVVAFFCDVWNKVPKHKVVPFFSAERVL